MKYEGLTESPASTDEKHGLIARKAVDSFYADFLLLVDKPQGMIFDMRISGETESAFPMKSEMDKSQYAKVRALMRNRIKYTIQELDLRFKKKTHQAAWDYVGKGRIVLWWRIVRTKKKRQDIL